MAHARARRRRQWHGPFAPHRRRSIFASRFFRDIHAAHALGIILTLFTNGTLITEAVAPRLAQGPANRTEITLYGTTAATYEAVTADPAVTRTAAQAIEAIVKHRTPLGLKTTLTQRNVGELETMRRMAAQVGRAVLSGWLLPGSTTAILPILKTAPVPQSCVTLEATDRASADEWTEAALRESSVGNNSKLFCQAGKAAFVVTPSGEMNACLDLTQPTAHRSTSAFAPRGSECSALWTMRRRSPPPASPAMRGLLPALPSMVVAGDRHIGRAGALSVRNRPHAQERYQKHV